MKRIITGFKSFFRILTFDEANLVTFSIAAAVVYGLSYFAFRYLGESLIVLCATVTADVFLVLLLITRRFFLSIFVTLSCLGLIYGSGIYKKQMLNSPFLAHDIYFFVQDFRDNISTFFQYPKIMLVVVTGCMVIALGAWSIYRRERPSVFKRAVVFLAISVICISASPMANSYNTYFGQEEMIDKIKLIGGSSDYLSKFISSFAFLTSDVRVDEKMGGKFSVLPVYNSNAKADIVAILEESSLNLASIKDCPEDFCNLDLFKEDRNTMQSGFLKVHVVGGGTWLSEFAFLTGLDHRTFGENGIYAPYTIAPRLKNSLIKNLKAQGYRTIAINPIEGDFLHAGDAYKDYGFDEVYSKESLGFGENWLKIYDADIYKKAIEFIEKANPAKPLFIFMLTIQNHGPHEDYLENEIPVVQFNKDSEVKSQIEVYRQRYQQSIHDIAEFEKYLLSRNKNTLVVRFGDHQPSFDGQIENLEFSYPFKIKENEKNYYTKYIIKSNYAGGNPRSVHEDLAFLAGDTLYYAGVRMNDFYKANHTFKEKCHGKYLDCDNNSLLHSYLGYAFGRLKIYQN